MKLAFQLGKWTAIGTFEEKEIPKSAGFKWDGAYKRWTAPSFEVALKLIDYASADDQVAMRDEADARVASSRATDADLEIPCPEGLAYLPFQRAGIAYAVARKDCLVADEMGLGKTVQALGVMNLDAVKLGRAPKTLIVAPKIALLNWKRETQKWLVTPAVVEIWTSKTQPECDVAIVNYDILAKPSIAAAIRARTWDVAVFDESHALKNGRAGRTQQALGYKKMGIEPITASRRLFLSGTPILNRPIEIYPILRSMRVPEAMDYYAFADRYCGGRDADGATNLDGLQALLRRNVMVRRLKNDVLTELPAKRYSVVELEADTPSLRKAIADEKTASAAAEATEKDLKAQIDKAHLGGTKAELDHFRFT